MDYTLRQTGIIWTSPKGTVFNLKTPDGKGGYKRKHIGEIKTSPNDNKKGQKNKTKKITDSFDTYTDSGVGGKEISLNFLFIGDSHDVEAETFCSALCETGKSRLKMAYGEEITVNVIDFSSTYSTLEKINSTIVSVNFHQTAKTTYPKSSTSDTKSVQNAADVTNTSVAENLSNALGTVQSASLLESVNANFTNILNKVSAALDTANTISLNSIMADIMGQTLTSNAFTMISQLQKVMQKASVTVSRIKTLMSNSNYSDSIPRTWNNSSSFGFTSQTWKNLVNDLLSNASTKAERLNQEQSLNLVTTDTCVVSALTAITTAAIEYKFDTRKEAINAATALVELDELRTDYITELQGKIDELENAFICDSGISELINMAANAIIEKSFGLKVERRIILTEDEPIINLAYKYYPDDFSISPEETVRYLIYSNDLKDDEFFILRRGTEIKIYV